MFDFGSDPKRRRSAKCQHEGPGDLRRKTRKDPFYFYKANWSASPSLTSWGAATSDRACATTDVKVYSNAEAVALLVNGAPAGTLTSSECPFRTCVFRNVALRPGRNVVVARGIGGQRRAPTRWSGRRPAART
jgi:beta-galactosidase